MFAAMQAARPTVGASVVIPVHESAEHLAACLTALANSDTAPAECIVVDDGSHQDIRSVAEHHGARYLRLDHRGGPAAARNRGAAAAREDILVFLDADVCAHPDALGRLTRHLTEHRDCTAVFGSYDDTPPDPHFVSQFKNLLHHYVHQTSRSRASTFWTGCGAIRRDVFLAYGGFDDSAFSVEDIELGVRLCADGHRIDLDHAIQVTHLKRWRLGNLIYTDIFKRAVPWLLLSMRRGSMPADLNLKGHHRVSVALTAALCLVLAGAIVSPAARDVALVAAVVVVAALLALNRDVYRFYARKRGRLFALRAIPMHWLYYAYCAGAIILALPLHLWQNASVRVRAPRTGAS